MNLNKYILIALAVLAVSCKNSISEKAYDQFTLVEQTKGETLGYNLQSGVKIIYEDGFAFKDLNRNGKLDVYEDWRQTPQARAKDLAAQIDIEQIAGLMLYSPHNVVDDSIPSERTLSFINDEKMRHILVTKVKNAYTA